ncbi:MAG: rRNA pseudouridine synthase [Eubacterium sp.]|nr:rRNA pseudouridine synthase [Eubacterium sp.]
MQLRLDKLLADAGFGTRSTVRTIIRRGGVTVDGALVRTPDMKVDITSSAVQVDGTPVFYETESYYILYKPAGILSASRDDREKTVVELIPEPKRRDLVPVGRLDRDTVGLLIITNDGKLNNRLMAPGKHVEKTYRTIVAGNLPGDTESRFAEGVDIGDEKPTAPARLTIRRILTDAEYEECLREHGISGESSLRAGEDTDTTRLTEGAGEEGKTADASIFRDPSVSLPLTEVDLTLTEGRYHQVKRMFEAVGCKVIFLKRIALGKLTLPEDMVPGEVRKLEYEDLIHRLGIR